MLLEGRPHEIFPPKYLKFFFTVYDKHWFPQLEGYIIRSCEHMSRAPHVFLVNTIGPISVKLEGGSWKAGHYVGYLTIIYVQMPDHWQSVLVNCIFAVKTCQKDY